MKKSVYEKPLKARPGVNLSTFSFMFSEIIQYFLEKEKDKFEENLEALGFHLGPRIHEFIIAKDKNYKREIKHLELLKIIHSSVWSTLFDKTAGALKKMDSHTYVIYDDEPLYLKFIPKREGKDYVYASFIGGIIRGLLDYAGFDAKVETQTPPNDGKSEYPTTAFVITFSEEVLKREAGKN